MIVGLFSVRRYRRDRIAWAKRRLQLKVLSLELKSLRQKVVSGRARDDVLRGPAAGNRPPSACQVPFGKNLSTYAVLRRLIKT